MNSKDFDTTKLQQMMDDSGFMPDGDLLEFGEKVIQECLDILDRREDLNAIRTIRKHFGV